MVELSEEQVDYVHDKLLDLGISYDSLRVDLVDHLCCITEEYMQQQQLDFSESFRRALQRFGIEHIQNTQETTLYLLTLKNRIMKKIAAISGIISSVLITAGVLFKINHMPGASIMLVLGISMAGLFVLPVMAIAEFNKLEGKQQKAVHIFGYLSGSLLFLGSLFRIMHWPGAMIQIFVGFFILCFIFMPLYTIKAYKSAENKLLALAKSTLILAAIFMLWGLLPNAELSRKQPTEKTKTALIQKQE